MEKEASKKKSADITENTKTLIKRLLRGDTKLELSPIYS
jgi:hypothetical protein